MTRISYLHSHYCTVTDTLLSQLHAAGKTDEAKNDMARLAKIRAEREAAQAKRKAEAEGASFSLLIASIKITDNLEISQSPRG